MKIEVNDQNQLERVIGRLKVIRDVIDVRRGFDRSQNRTKWRTMYRVSNAEDQKQKEYLHNRAAEAAEAYAAATAADLHRCR